MATDIKAIISNLYQFYNPDGKTIITVGAGGGQLIDYYKDAKLIYGIDTDQDAIEKLKIKIAENLLEEKYKCIHADFLSINQRGDVVLFEFSLHEMDDISKALDKGRKLASTVIIIDHSWQSKWIQYIDEAEKVERVRKYLEKERPKRIKSFHAKQYFSHYKELEEKVKSQGEKAINSIQEFKGKEKIEIDFEYITAEY